MLTLLSVTPERRRRSGWRWGPNQDPKIRDSTALSSSGDYDLRSQCSAHSLPQRRRKSHKLTPDDTPVRWSRLPPWELLSFRGPPRTRDRPPHWSDPSSLIQRLVPEDRQLRHLRLSLPDYPVRISTPWTKVSVNWRSTELVAAPPLGFSLHGPWRGSGQRTGLRWPPRSSTCACSATWTRSKILGIISPCLIQGAD